MQNILPLLILGSLCLSRPGNYFPDCGISGRCNCMCENRCCNPGCGCLNENPCFDPCSPWRCPGCGCSDFSRACYVPHRSWWFC